MTKNHNRQPRNHHFLADGRERVQRALRPKIRVEVEREFASAIHSANWFRRWHLRMKVEREISRRLDEKAPRDALYYHS